MKFFNKHLLIFCLIVLVSACSTVYYQAGAIDNRSDYPAAINQAKKEKTRLMLHSGVNLYTVTSVEVAKSNQQITVQLEKPDSTYLVNGGLSNTGKRSSRSLHIYLNDSTSYTLDEPHTIALEKVSRMEVAE